MCFPRVVFDGPQRLCRPQVNWGGVIPDYIGDGGEDQKEIMHVTCDGIGEEENGADCDAVATGNDNVEQFCIRRANIRSGR